MNGFEFLKALEKEQGKIRIENKRIKLTCSNPHYKQMLLGDPPLRKQIQLLLGLTMVRPDWTDTPLFFVNHINEVETLQNMGIKQGEIYTQKERKELLKLSKEDAAKIGEIKLSLNGTVKQAIAKDIEDETF